MYEKFCDKFVKENCDECDDFYGHDRDKYENICPIYKLLYSAMHGMRDFPTEYIDIDNNICNKNYDIENGNPMMHHIKRERKTKDEKIEQKEKLF